MILKVLFPHPSLPPQAREGTGNDAAAPEQGRVRVGLLLEKI